MNDSIRLCQLLDTLKRCNIPLDAKIEMATAWECSEVDLDMVYYCPGTNTLAFVSEGAENWYDSPDWLRLAIPSYVSKTDNPYGF